MSQLTIGQKERIDEILDGYWWSLDSTEVSTIGLDGNYSLSQLKELIRYLEEIGMK